MVYHRGLTPALRRLLATASPLNTLLCASDTALYTDEQMLALFVAPPPPPPTVAAVNRIPPTGGLVPSSSSLPSSSSSPSRSGTSSSPSSSSAVPVSVAATATAAAAASLIPPSDQKEDAGSGLTHPNGAAVNQAQAEAQAQTIADDPTAAAQAGAAPTVCVSADEQLQRTAVAVHQLYHQLRSGLARVLLWQTDNMNLAAALQQSPPPSQLPKEERPLRWGAEPPQQQRNVQSQSDEKTDSLSLPETASAPPPAAAAADTLRTHCQYLEQVTSAVAAALKQIKQTAQQLGEQEQPNTLVQALRLVTQDLDDTDYADVRPDDAMRQLMQAALEEGKSKLKPTEGVFLGEGELPESEMSWRRRDDFDDQGFGGGGGSGQMADLHASLSVLDELRSVLRHRKPYAPVGGGGDGDVDD